MRRNRLTVMCVAILMIIPSVVFADCVTLRDFSSFSVEEGYKVTLYNGQTPFAKFDLQDCSVHPFQRFVSLRVMCAMGTRLR
jgi:hypothetical protein